MLRSPYSDSEFPPAPHVAVNVSPPRRSQLSVELDAKVDSAAALTVLPIGLVRGWRLRRHHHVRLRAYDGTTALRPTFQISLIIGSREFRPLRVSATHRSNVLLGRDVLNQLIVTLNGPALTLEIHDA